MESIHRPVRPIRTVAPYQGGKRNSARRLVALIEDIPHALYAEPFVGMGGVFLKRRRAAPREVINDASRDVICLFRCVQEHYAYFVDNLRFRLASRAEFDRLAATDPATLTDIQRAARFLCLQRLAFGGKIVGRNFGADPSRPSRFDVTRIGGLLEELHERLAGVVIECLPFEAFIPRYDTAETLFYLDPPYWGSERDYGEGLFGRDDFERLAAALRGLAGRFILSLNDRPEVREIFAGFDIQAVDVPYSIAGGAARRFPSW